MQSTCLVDTASHSHSTTTASPAEDIIRVPSYTDDTVASGEYFYAVTAVDDAPAANESAHSELSEVTFTP